MTTHRRSNENVDILISLLYLTPSSGMTVFEFRNAN